MTAVKLGSGGEAESKTALAGPGSAEVGLANISPAFRGSALTSDTLHRGAPPLQVLVQKGKIVLGLQAGGSSRSHDSGDLAVFLKQRTRCIRSMGHTETRKLGLTL